MNTVSDCAVCLLKIARTSARAAKAKEPEKMRAVKAALRLLAEDDFSRIPPLIARDVIEQVNRALGVSDPFAELKKEHDEKALSLVQSWAANFLEEAKTEQERLWRAVKAALAGNILDMASMPEDLNPSHTLKYLDTVFAINHFSQFENALLNSPDVLYLCDNAGEIAFDRVLIQELLDRGKQVTVSVKGGPALNDATMEDALLVGMDKLRGPSGPVRLITTGQAHMGVHLESASPEWRQAFFSAHMVIAKGQANLESLHNAGREIFFLTLVKCSHVAAFYQVPKGSALLLQGGKDDADSQTLRNQ